MIFFDFGPAAAVHRPAARRGAGGVCRTGGYGYFGSAADGQHRLRMPYFSENAYLWRPIAPFY